MPKNRQGRPPKLAHDIEMRIRAEYAIGKPALTPLPTILQLAKQYDVSQETIRLAMVRLVRRGAVERRGSGRAHVARGRYLQWLDYAGKMLAVSFFKRSNPLNDNFQQNVIRGLLDGLRDTGINLLLNTRHWDQPRDDCPANHYSTKEILGVFLMGRHAPALTKQIQVLERKMLVSLDHDATPSDISSVCFDNFNAGAFLAQRLHKLGHVRIAAVFEASDLPKTKRDPAWDQRQNGFEKTWEKFGAEKISIIHSRQRGTPIEFLDDIHALLRKPPTERPTAIYLPTPSGIEKIKELAGHLGMGVPKDLTLVCCCDDLPSNQTYTSMQFDGIDMALTGIDYMLHAIANPRPGRRKPTLMSVKGRYQAGQTHAKARMS